MKFVRHPIATAALFASLVGTAPAFAGSVTIDFEGATSFSSIGQYYNGGADEAGASGGANYGVSFSGAAQALKNDGLDTYFSNAPTPGTVMFSAPEASASMDVASGFAGDLSFFYSATTSALDVVTIYSGLGNTGSVLGSVSLSANAQLSGCTDTAYCNWQRISLSFAGVGRSVSFGGNPGRVAFDNVSITPVPEPTTYALLALGLAGVMVATRRQRQG